MSNELPARIEEALDAAWLLAAATRVMLRQGSEEVDAVDAAAERVIHSAGVTLPEDRAALMWGRGLRSQIAQLLAVADASDAARWEDMDDATLLAQGRASGANIGALLCDDERTPDAVRDRLSRPDAVFLDVGVGVGGICAALCQGFPQLRCIGLDIMPRVLRLAEHELGEAGVLDRVELRELNIEHMTDTGVVDVAWLPLPLVSSSAAIPAVRNVARALRPDGWIVVAATEHPADEADAAIAALRAAAVGGCTAFRDDVLRWLDDVGVADLTEITTNAGGIVLAGRRAVAPSG